MPQTDVVVFHAGTVETGGDVVTSGGRVIAVSAYATTLQGALDAAYAGVDQVDFEGKTYRRDIAHRYVRYAYCLCSTDNLTLNSVP